jgi:hypothetical protein
VYFGPCIYVNGAPLFYQTLSTTYVKKIESLNWQYRRLKGKQLVLSIGKLQVPLDLPIGALEIADHKLRLFEEFLNILNDPTREGQFVSPSYL